MDTSSVGDLQVDEIVSLAPFSQQLTSVLVDTHNSSQPKLYNEDDSLWSLVKIILGDEETIYLEADGDLTLVVGGGECDDNDADSDYEEDRTIPTRFVVCSKTMKRAFKVFGAMLSSQYCFVESKPASGPWVVHLPEDAPEPMFVMLCFGHGLFHNIPQTMTLPELYDLLVLTNKYLFTPHITPWIQNWLGAYVMSASKVQFLTRQQQYQVIWVAWELGDHQLLARAIQQIARDCNKIPRMFTIGNRGLVLKNEMFPEGSGVIAVMNMVIENFHQIIYDEVSGGLLQYYEGNLCKKGNASDDCSKQVHDALVAICHYAGSGIDYFRYKVFQETPRTIRQTCDRVSRRSLRDCSGHTCFSFKRLIRTLQEGSDDRVSWLTRTQERHVQNQAHVSGWRRLD
ncbi:nuclear pore protein-like protein [Colletotrichum truncatum]|uniref:Nuclear pore protein-like protein n=1 Tax=Colletotrichum truncatum TaxID=5467 RepID=A0ACC3YVT9_COLTU|nr:nuclear pore protein-like protein [Colletotrichum truncatum]KAF6791268.1 nuclear pore protein-like protein [Colletotrichum truncatum]